MRSILFLLIASSSIFCAASKKKQERAPIYVNKKEIKTGAEQTDKYLPLLKEKRVAIMANQTSIIGKTHLVDSLKTLGVNIVKVFGPEHGFRGNASAGEHVADEIDPVSRIPVVSLYGGKNKPTKEDLADVDILILHFTLPVNHPSPFAICANSPTVNPCDIGMGNMPIPDLYFMSSIGPSIK